MTRAIDKCGVVIPPQCNRRQLHHQHRRSSPLKNAPSWSASSWSSATHASTSARRWRTSRLAGVVAALLSCDSAPSTGSAGRMLHARPRSGSAWDATGISLNEIDYRHGQLWRRSGCVVDPVVVAPAPCAADGHRCRAAGHRRHANGQPRPRHRLWSRQGALHPRQQEQRTGTRQEQRV